MTLPRCSFMCCLLAACFSQPFPCSLLAQSTNRQIGTQFEVTADPLVQRPHGQPCVVQLFAGYTFAFFSSTDQTFSFSPPASCPGPWKKVVLDIDFSENGGVQFDRTASLYIANANIYFGTTPEPLPVLTNTWHVEHDITDYSALLPDSPDRHDGAPELHYRLTAPVQHPPERSFHGERKSGILSRQSGFRRRWWPGTSPRHGAAARAV